MVTETLYPNPSKTGIFQLSLAKDYKSIDIMVCNVAGHLEKSIKAKSINKKINIDLSNFKSGVYFLNMSGFGEHIITKKAVIGQ